MTSSELLFQESLKKVPGGVHSPVRSFKGLHCTPRFIERAAGAKIYDVDGKEYIDFCMSFGPLILGHKDPAVEEKLHEALGRGWSYGACEPYSLKLATFILERITFLENIRFVNSGTEAVMTALRIARGSTRRNKVLKFNGCFHGHVDSMLIKAGSGLAGEAESSSLGVSEQVARDTLIVNLHDTKALKAVFEKEGKDLAAVILEPLPANYGLIPMDKNYLELLRELCTRTGCLLIFDEVISGFRVGFGGMAQKLGITPDLVTYGKVIGGGLPVGAVAGKAHFMQNLAPVGGVYQAGTLSANPLAMIGGLATLERLTESFYATLHTRTDKMFKVFQHFFAESAFSDYSLVSEGSLFWIYPSHKPVKEVADIPSNLNERFYKLFEHCLSRGIYLAPNAYEIGFLSWAHDDETIAEVQRRLCRP